MSCKGLELTVQLYYERQKSTFSNNRRSEAVSFDNQIHHEFYGWLMFLKLINFPGRTGDAMKSRATPMIEEEK